MNVLTIDLEDWFHILDNDSTKTESEWIKFAGRFEENSRRLLDLLCNHGVSATFFVLGWIARRYPDTIKEISSLGFDVGCHSDMHQLVYEQSAEDFEEDLKRGIGSIEDLTGKKVKSYRAPGFSIGKNCSWVFPILAFYGIEVDCSIFPAKRAHGGYREFSRSGPVVICGDQYEIKEVPISIENILGLSIAYSGGGYFRLLPYKVISNLVRKNDYNMMYFHPRDFDINQPVISDLSAFRRFKSYYGIKGAYKKLDQLLASFDFVDVKQFVERTDWEKVERVYL